MAQVKTFLSDAATPGDVQQTSQQQLDTARNVEFFNAGTLNAGVVKVRTSLTVPAATITTATITTATITSGAFTNMPTVGGTAIVASGTSASGTYVKFSNGIMVCFGDAAITPVANTPTSVAVTMPATFSSATAYSAFASALTTVPYTEVRECSTIRTSASVLTVYITRTNTTAATVCWFAIGTWS